MFHQAKAWKNQAKSFYTKFQKEKVQRGEVEENLKGKEEELATAHAELVDLRAKKNEFFDAYMDSSDFQALMEKHDEIMFPGQYTDG